MTVADLIQRLLAKGPVTGFEIARRLEADHKVPLAGREGVIYAALYELERGGFIESEVREREDGNSRRYYRLPVLADVNAGKGAP
jgi:DNA-binding PadR family transcriptional regulator